LLNLHTRVLSVYAQIFIISTNSTTLTNNRNLLAFLGISQAADIDNDHNLINLSDSMFNSISSNIKDCKYYDISSLSNHLYCGNATSNLLFKLHVNIRSLSKNFEDFYDLLLSLPHQPDIVCVSETRIKHNSLVNISLPGYQFFHTDSNINARGEAMYLSTKFQCDIYSSCNLNPPQCEDLWINIKVNWNKNLIVGVIYHHPNTNIKTFVNELSPRFQVLLQLINFIIC